MTQREAIDKGYIKLYQYEYFSNIQEIGSGGFGKVFRDLRNNICAETFF